MRPRNAVEAPDAPVGRRWGCVRAVPLSILAAGALLAGLLAAPTQAQDLVAPAGVCAGATEEETALCLVNYARRHAGLEPFSRSVELDRAAAAKSEDILRCDSFSHFACGRDFTYWIRRADYLTGRCWRAAENLAWGVGAAATARSAFRSWMASPPHRRNILGPYGEIGIGLEVGELGGRAGTHVWTQHLGAPCR